MASSSIASACRLLALALQYSCAPCVKMKCGCSCVMCVWCVKMRCGCSCVMCVVRQNEMRMLLCDVCGWNMGMQGETPSMPSIHALHLFSPSMPREEEQADKIVANKCSQALPHTPPHPHTHTWWMSLAARRSALCCCCSVLPRRPAEPVFDGDGSTISLKAGCVLPPTSSYEPCSEQPLQQSASILARLPQRTARRPRLLTCNQDLRELVDVAACHCLGRLEPFLVEQARTEALDTCVTGAYVGGWRVSKL